MGIIMVFLMAIAVCVCVEMQKLAKERNNKETNDDYMIAVEKEVQHQLKLAKAENNEESEDNDNL